MVRERLPQTAPPESVPVVATTAQLPEAPARPVPQIAQATPPAPVPVPPAPAPQAPDADASALAAAVPAVALASVRRQDNATRRGAATRNQQVARNAATRQQQVPPRLVASASTPPAAVAPAPVEAGANPFAHPGTLHAKPWPRSGLTADADGSPLSAGFSRQERGATFYPFEPQMPAQDVVSESAPLLLPQD